jgi:hypothetical protein
MPKATTLLRSCPLLASGKAASCFQKKKQKEEDPKAAQQQQPTEGIYCTKTMYIYNACYTRGKRGLCVLTARWVMEMGEQLNATTPKQAKSKK